MAFPTVTGTPTKAATASSTSHTVTLPASIAAGELLMVFFTARFASTPKTSGYTWPAGWTEIEDEAFDTSGNSAKMGVAYRIADGSEGGTNITVTTAAASEGAYIAFRINNWHGTTPPEKGTAVTSSGGATPDPPNLAPSWGAADNLWIVFAARNIAGGSTLVAYPANYTSNQNDQASATLVRGNVATRALNAASENPGAFSFSSGQFEVVNTFAVRPANAGSLIFNPAPFQPFLVR